MGAQADASPGAGPALSEAQPPWMHDSWYVMPCAEVLPFFNFFYFIFFTLFFRIDRLQSLPTNGRHLLLSRIENDQPY